MNTCAGCGRKIEDEHDAVAIELERLKKWCSGNGITLVRGDRLRLDHVARYLDLTTKTIQNWVYLPNSPFNVQRGRKRTYILAIELAEFVANEEK